MILTPTEFIRSAIEKALPDALCLDYPQVVDVIVRRWARPGPVGHARGRNRVRDII